MSKLLMKKNAKGKREYTLDQVDPEKESNLYTCQNCKAEGGEGYLCLQHKTFFCSACVHTPESKNVHVRCKGVAYKLPIFANNGFSETCCERILVKEIRFKEQAKEIAA